MADSSRTAFQCKPNFSIATRVQVHFRKDVIQLCLFLLSSFLCNGGYGNDVKPENKPNNQHEVKKETTLFERLSLERGLSSISVTAIIQDHHGFMWIGTPAGLNKYDGYKFTLYKNNPSNANSLADNWVSALHEDESGKIWIGTRAGLQHYDAARDLFVTHDVASEIDPNKREPIIVNKILDDLPNTPQEQRGLWLATYKGVRHFNFQTQQFDISIQDDYRSDLPYAKRVNDIAWDQAGNLWLARAASIDKVDPKAKLVQHFDTKDIANYSLLNAKDNTMWIGTREGLESWNITKPEPIRSKQTKAGKSLGWVISLLEDRQGRLWIGTESNGLYRRALTDTAPNVQYEQYQNAPKDQHSLSANSVYGLYLDRADSLWAGTWTGGLNRTDLGSQGFGRYDHLISNLTGKSDDRIHTVAVDKNSILWLGTSDGLVLFNPKTQDYQWYQTDVNKPGSLPNNWVQVIYFSRRQQTWIGTKDGLALFDPIKKSFENYRFREGEEQTNWIYDIAENDDGSLWIACLTGLFYFDPISKKVEKYHHDAKKNESLLDDRVTSVFRDHAKRLWVGGLSGLDIFDEKTKSFTHLQHHVERPHSLSGNGIIHMTEDSKQRLWIATSSGLNRLEKFDGENSVFRRLNDPNRTTHSLRGEPTGGILEDSRGAMWVSTSDGISQIVNDDKINNFTYADGLLSGPYLWVSTSRSEDGVFYFGNSMGLTAFRPEDIHENQIAPIVLLTELQVFNQTIRGEQRPAGVQFDAPIHDTKKLVLAYFNSVFSLEFSALHFSNVVRNQYAYQLEGFDKDWVYTDAQHRLATYTNLDPGTYTFKVRASNGSGLWNEQGSRIEIIITPPFWKTIWFRALMLTSIFGLIWLAHKQRVRRLEMQQEKLEQLVIKRTSEVVQQKKFIGTGKTRSIDAKVRG